MKATKYRIGRVPAIILQPSQRDPAPVAVLWIHGGGYITGMKEMVYFSRAADFLREYGVTVFSPGYRLAWQKPWPAAIDDCWEVLAYMDANRQAYGFSHLFVGGESAGGGLAAAICMMARDRGIQIDYQFPLYPMLSNLDTDSSADNHGHVWNTRRNHLGWKMYLRGDAKKEVSPYASPAQETDYRNLPPCYTFVGEGEPFYSETLSYVRNLQKADVNASVDVYPTDVHAFDLLRPDSEIAREAKQKLMEQFGSAMRQVAAIWQKPEHSC